MSPTPPKLLSVAAIETGTVIDHITAGKAIFFLRLLGLENYPGRISLGLNLTSRRFKIKDLIKIEGWGLDKDNVSKIAVFSPQATISIIDHYKVVDKYIVPLPKKIDGFLRCPNGNCVTNHEHTSTSFILIPQSKTHLLQCQFCEKKFSYQEIPC